MNISKTELTEYLTNPNRYIQEINDVAENWDKYNTLVNLIISQNEPRFQWSDELVELYRNTTLYFLGNRATIFDLNKGLYIHGSPGSGKSLILRFIYKFFTGRLGVNSYRVVLHSDIIQNATKNGIIAINDYVRTNDKPITLLIDDFGAGNRHISNYGNQIDVFTELIALRYNDFKRYGTLTHITSNIKPHDIKTEFDERISSRLSEMCNRVKFPNIDHRKL